MFKTARRRGEEIRRSVAEMKKGILIVENSGAEGQEEGGKKPAEDDFSVENRAKVNW